MLTPLELLKFIKMAKITYLMLNKCQNNSTLVQSIIWIIYYLHFRVLMVFPVSQAVEDWDRNTKVMGSIPVNMHTDKNVCINLIPSKSLWIRASFNA